MPYLPYLDTIRFVAMLMVIVCHACDPFNAGATYGAGDTNADMFLWGSIWGSAVRACVPLFVMLMGVLNLPVKWPMEVYWRKRIFRVLWPFLIWSAVYNLFPWLLGLLGFGEESVYYFFVWASSPKQDFATCFDRVLEVPLLFDYIACHMWYIYMLVGLYLFTPILSAWVAQASRRQIELVLGLWAVSTLLPYLHEFYGRYLFGECEWSGFGTFHYFAGYAGYMLMGYYIVRYVPVRTVPSLAYALPAFAAGALITYFGFRTMTARPDCTPEQTELFWNYCTPNVALMSSALFVALRLIPTGGWVARALANFTVCGFGIYMTHYFFVGPTYDWVERMMLPTWLRVPAAAVLVTAITWALVALTKRIYPRSRWLLG